MKTQLFLFFIILSLLPVFALNTFAQDSPQWHLPEGAKARLGKGGVNDIQYSPDGKRLAVASAVSLSIWRI